LTQIWVGLLLSGIYGVEFWNKDFYSYIPSILTAYLPFHSLKLKYIFIFSTTVFGAIFLIVCSMIEGFKN